MSTGRKEWREGERERRKDERKEGGTAGRREKETHPTLHWLLLQEAISGICQNSH